MLGEINQDLLISLLWSAICCTVGKIWTAQQHLPIACMHYSTIRDVAVLYHYATLYITMLHCISLCYITTCKLYHLICYNYHYTILSLQCNDITTLHHQLLIHYHHYRAQLVAITVHLMDAGTFHVHRKLDYLLPYRMCWMLAVKL